MPVASTATRSPQHQALMQTAARAGLALAGRSREFEQQRALPQDVADLLADAGLYRLLTPQALGGHEAPPASFYLVVEQLARADAAAAWCCFISCTASLLAAYLPDASATALFIMKTPLTLDISKAKAASATVAMPSGIISTDGTIQPRAAPTPGLRRPKPLCYPPPTMSPLANRTIATVGLMVLRPSSW